jgi:hypothetical protein
LGPLFYFSFGGGDDTPPHPPGGTALVCINLLHCNCVIND